MKRGGKFLVSTTILAVTACGGDPGDEDAVRVVHEMVPGEGVDEVVIAGDERGGDGHDLALARSAGHRGGGCEQLHLGRKPVRCVG